RVERALLAVDQQDAGVDRLFLSRPGPEAPRDDFADRGEVVHALHAANAVAPIARFEGQAVDERHEGRDRAFAAEMGDIHAFDDARDATQPEDLAQARGPFFRLDLKDLGLHVLIDFAAQAEAAQGADLVAQPRRLFVALRGAGVGHRLLHLLDELFLLPFEHEPQRADLLSIGFLGHAEIARRRALPDAVQKARPEPAPARIVFLDVERAGAEFEDALQHLDRRPQALGAREGTVELDAAPPRRPRELHARVILAHADLQVREALVVFQVDVEARLDVLDQPGLHQEGVDFGLGREK